MHDLSTTVYATATGTKYHRQECETLEVAATRGVVRSLTAEAALAEQLAPCGVCKPPALADTPPTPEVVNLTKAAVHVVAAHRAYRESGFDATATLLASAKWEAVALTWEALTGLELADAIAYAELLAARPEHGQRAAVLPF